MSQRISSLTLLCLLAGGFAAAGPAPVHMANGIKVGEATQTSAIVRARLTAAPERNKDGYPWPHVDSVKASEKMSTREICGGHAIAEMEGSVPGMEGDVRVTWWPADAPDAKHTTAWGAVEPWRDYTRQFRLDTLSPGTQYRVLVEGRPAGAEAPGCSVEGQFRTPPAVDRPAPVRFVVMTCQDYPRRDDPENGHKIYVAMRKLDPDFFVHTGDIEYYDKGGPYAPSQALARLKWNRLYAMPFQRAFHNGVTSYFIKDDHDTLKNDCWPGQRYGELTWEQGLATFREQVPMGDKTYRTVRWGEDLQIWMVENRDFRSPNIMPDGPDKTIWGEEQMAWFKRTVSESGATFRVLISPNPLVGPDRKNKNDNHSNAGFEYEGSRLRRFIAAQDNMIVINGDRHWQYASVDDETGLREWGTGPASDVHAGGWDQDDFRPEHRYLNLVGGFLEVEVEREDGVPTMSLRHHGVDGGVLHEDVLKAEARS